MSIPRRKALLLAVLAASAGGLAVWLLRGPYHFLVVEEGTLYRSGLLAPDELERVLRRHGIRTVVNLQPRSINALPWHAAEAAACARAGAELVDLPLEAGTPPTAEEVTRWLELMDDPARRPVLVHCQHGVIRTGMLVAAFQIARRGYDNDRAWRELPTFGHRLHLPRHGRMRRFVQTFDPVGSAAPVPSTVAPGSL